MSLLYTMVSVIALSQLSVLCRMLKSELHSFFSVMVHSAKCIDFREGITLTGNSPYQTTSFQSSQLPFPPLFFLGFTCLRKGCSYRCQMRNCAWACLPCINHVFHVLTKPTCVRLNYWPQFFTPSCICALFSLQLCISSQRRWYVFFRSLTLASTDLLWLQECVWKMGKLGAQILRDLMYFACFLYVCYHHKMRGRSHTTALAAEWHEGSRTSPLDPPNHSPRHSWPCSPATPGIRESMFMGACY